MEEERRIIYMGNDNPFEIYCKEEDIKMEILIKLHQFDDNIQYCKIGDQNSQNYIAFSLPMLIKQKNEHEQITKQNQEQLQEIKKLKNQLEKIEETQRQDQLFKQLTTEEFNQIKLKLKESEDTLSILQKQQENKKKEEEIKIEKECRKLLSQQKEIKVQKEKFSKEIEIEKEQLKNQYEYQSRELVLKEEQLKNQYENKFKELEVKEDQLTNQSIKLENKSKELEVKKIELNNESIQLWNKSKELEVKEEQMKKESIQLEIKEEKLKNQQIQNQSKELEVNEVQLTKESIQLESLKKVQFKEYKLEDISIKTKYNDLREENRKLKQELESQQQKYEKFINLIHEEHNKKDNLIIEDLKKQIDDLKFDLSQKCLNGSEIKNLCNNPIGEQLTQFQESLNYKLSEVFLNENHNLTQISCDDLSQKLMQEFSEQDYNSALQEHFVELPFQSQVLQLKGLQFVLKIKQVSDEKMTLSQIKDQILNNLLCYKLMKLFFLDKKGGEQTIIDFERVRIPRQFIIKDSNGNYYYCEEFIKGETKIFSVKNNEQTIDILVNQFFLYCYNQTNKKKIFTQMSYNENDHIVSNIIGYDNLSIFKTREIIAQLKFFQILLNKAKSFEDTTYSLIQLDI